MQVKILSIEDFINRRIVEGPTDSNKKVQFTVPIYQRPYSWGKDVCMQLWRDIDNIVRYGADDKHHFLGSIVTLSEKHDKSKILKEKVVDGQQRLTTLMLLIVALIEKVESKDRADELKESYLINSEGKEKDDLKYKMLLTPNDKQSLINIIEGRKDTSTKSDKMEENFKFFQEKLKDEDAERIHKRGIKRLKVIHVLLDSLQDEPQRVFESLNSKGVPLSKADLIRNHIIMELPDQKQEALYRKHWQPMEEIFEQKNADRFDEFIRHYLIMEISKIPSKKNLYEEFKKYYKEKKEREEEEAIVKRIHKYAKYYANIALDGEKKEKLKKAFTSLNTLKVTVSYPFLLAVYNDYSDEKINEACFLKILFLIESYTVRRAFLNKKTNALDNIFSNFSKKIQQITETDKQNNKSYLESFKKLLLNIENKDYQFRNDEELKNRLKEEKIYTSGRDNKRGKFLLEKLESHLSGKEFVDTESLQIEHIMPQKIDKVEEWKEMLGKDWKDVHKEQLHMLGNLTLTGYNPTYGNAPFCEKKTMSGGFDESPLRLNESLKDVEKWDEQAIIKRTELLSEKMIKIWPCPELPKEILDKYRKPPKYTIKNFPELSRGVLEEVFTNFREKVKNLEPDVREEFLQQYIAYKFVGNFACIVPRQSKLYLFLSLDYKEIDDPKQLCKDYTIKDHAGTGDTMFELSSLQEIEYAMFLIKQALEKTMEE